MAYFTSWNIFKNIENFTVGNNNFSDFDIEFSNNAADKDENIRYKVASRIPAEKLTLLINDPYKEVRLIVAKIFKFCNKNRAFGICKRQDIFDF